VENFILLTADVRMRITRDAELSVQLGRIKEIGTCYFYMYFSAHEFHGPKIILCFFQKLLRHYVCASIYTTRPAHRLIFIIIIRYVGAILIHTDFLHFVNNVGLSFPCKTLKLYRCNNFFNRLLIRKITDKVDFYKRSCTTIIINSAK
jgi:hypothetical protein